MNKKILIIIDEDLADLLNKVSKLSGRSRNNTINYILNKHIREYLNKELN